MKRAILFFVLGFMVAFYIMYNRSDSMTHPMHQSQDERISQVANVLTELRSGVKTWWSGFKNQDFVQDDSIITTSTYDVALEIVAEMIEDIESLLTSEQKAAIEKEVNQLYRENILKEYGDSTENPKYRE